MDPGPQLAADRGCYNCHGIEHHEGVPSFQAMVRKWSHFNGKPEDGAVRHAAWHVVLVCVEGGTLAKRAVPPRLAAALARFRGPAVA